MSLAIAGCFALALGGCGGDSDSSSSSTTTAPVETACADLLTQFKMDGVTLTKAEAVAAAANIVGMNTTGQNTENSGPMPAHCLIQGKADARTSTVDGKSYAIGFEVRMPTTGWNGRFFFQGGGGSNGALAMAYGNLRGNILDSSGKPTDNALNRGFAVASTDGGHLIEAGTDANASNAFGVDPLARLDFGYNAVARTTTIAKALIAKRFGKSADHSYFVGCSNGGRDAMMASQRLPDQFDGVFALNPGFQMPKAAVNQAWDTQQFNSVSPGTIFDAFSQADLDAVSKAVLNACDADDGAKDGLIFDQKACAAKFNPDTALAGVLTAPQLAALKKVFGGAKDSSGNAIYSDFPWDAGINYKDWRDWKLGIGAPSVGVAKGAGKAISIGAYSLPAVFMQPSAPITGDTVFNSSNGFAFQLNLKTQTNLSGTVDPELIYATSGIYNVPSINKTAYSGGFIAANSTNYDTFKARGSKLIVAHGTSDGVFSSNDTKSWYETLSTKYGSNTQSFARYFQIPGMNHCAGGATTDKFDMVTALVDWVEKGTAPESVEASSRDQSYQYASAPWSTTYKPTLIAAGITRPLCAYPKQAKSTDQGATWTCQ
ncbi:tannase/feruloyl esterase family alpha/beta hydrolase [Propionivibrio limicola]|uniref:tannase/feruloyl esterase family alpha/beta hydrolase n=1 Tax=Propionivibrio limicola TaxID=167645 RepID=UPI0014792086|nr:tannase/feruloyl esterase family alpha/beta hydrolase [Propionivibrio limicola]